MRVILILDLTERVKVMNEGLVSRFIDNVKYFGYRDILACEKALQGVKAKRIEEMEAGLGELRGDGGRGWEPVAIAESLVEVIREAGLESGRNYRISELVLILGAEVRTVKKVYTTREALEVLKDEGVVTSGNGFWCFDVSRF